MSQQSESALRERMSEAINHHHPRRALSLLADWRDAHGDPVEAETWFQAALASQRARKGKAFTYISYAEKCGDFTPAIKGRYLRDIAIQQTDGRHFDTAMSLLRSSDRLLAFNPNEQLANAMARARIALFRNDRYSVALLRSVRRDYIEMARHGQEINEQYLLNTSWLLLIASAKFDVTPVFVDTLCDIQLDIRIRLDDKSGYVRVCEPSELRQRIAALLNRFPKQRSRIATALIISTRRP